MLDFAISVVGVLIFVGLTAYDTQKIKESYYESHGADVLAKGAIMGALSLYLDFINLFMMLLRLFGNRELSGPAGDQQSGWTIIGAAV